MHTPAYSHCKQGTPIERPPLSTPSSSCVSTWHCMCIILSLLHACRSVCPLFHNACRRHSPLTYLRTATITTTTTTSPRHLISIAPIVGMYCPNAPVIRFNMTLILPQPAPITCNISMSSTRLSSPSCATLLFVLVVIVIVTNLIVTNITSHLVWSRLGPILYLIHISILSTHPTRCCNSSRRSHISFTYLSDFVPPFKFPLHNNPYFNHICFDNGIVSHFYRYPRLFTDRKPTFFPPYHTCSDSECQRP